MLIFYDDNLEEILDLFNDSQSGLEIPNIVSNLIENGKIEIKCNNENSMENLKTDINSLAFQPSCSDKKYPIIILPRRFAEARIRMSITIDEDLEWTKLVMLISASNEFNASRWNYSDYEEIAGEGFKIYFLVDAISFRILMKNNYSLKIKDKLVFAKIEFNPFAEDIINFLKVYEI